MSLIQTLSVSSCARYAYKLIELTVLANLTYSSWMIPGSAYSFNSMVLPLVLGISVK